MRRFIGLVCVWVLAITFNSYGMSGYGNQITDIEKNPRGLPMLDSYSRPESRSTFIIDYSRFWGETGLGDFTNKQARNSVSYEFASDTLNSEGAKVISQIPDAHIQNGYWVAENRICVALPPGAVIDPDIFEPLIPDTWRNRSMYTDTSWWTKGAPALSYLPGIMDKDLLGMHVDCVLADGTVLPLIITDLKALHKGLYNGELCDDAKLDGYGHWRGYASTGECAYLGILEVDISSGYREVFDKNKFKDLNLENNKIVEFRCYGETKGRFK